MSSIFVPPKAPIPAFAEIQQELLQTKRPTSGTLPALFDKKKLTAAQQVEFSRWYSKCCIASEQAKAFKDASIPMFKTAELRTALLAVDWSNHSTVEKFAAAAYAGILRRFYAQPKYLGRDGDYRFYLRSGRPLLGFAEDDSTTTAAALTAGTSKPADAKPLLHSFVSEFRVLVPAGKPATTPATKSPFTYGFCLGSLAYDPVPMPAAKPTTPPEPADNFKLRELPFNIYLDVVKCDVWLAYNHAYTDEYGAEIDLGPDGGNVWTILPTEQKTRPRFRLMRVMTDIRKKWDVEDARAIFDADGLATAADIQIQPWADVTRDKVAQAVLAGKGALKPGQ